MGISKCLKFFDSLSFNTPPGYKYVDVYDFIASQLGSQAVRQSDSHT